VECVSFQYQYNNKSYPVVYDNSIDKPNPFLSEFIEDNNLPESEKEKIRQAIKETFAKERELVAKEKKNKFKKDWISLHPKIEKPCRM